MSPSVLSLSRRGLFLPLSIAALLLGPLLALAQARPGAFEVTARSGLVVHSGPGGGYRSLGALEPGARVTTLEERGAWRKIRFHGRDAWVHAKYLRPAAAERAREVPAEPAAPGSGSGGNIVDALEGRDGSAAAAQPAEADGDGDESGDGAEHAASPPGEGAATPAVAVVPSRLPRSRAGFVQLPASGPGFVSYAPANRRWGTTTMVYGLIRIGERWAGRGARMMIGDISLENGGKVSGHVSHRKGVDVDVRPVSKNGREGPVVWQSSQYDRPLTHELLGLFHRELPIAMIFFNDPRAPGVRKWKNHDNHFHARTTR